MQADVLFPWASRTSGLVNTLKTFLIISFMELLMPKFSANKL